MRGETDMQHAVLGLLTSMRISDVVRRGTEHCICATFAQNSVIQLQLTVQRVVGDHKKLRKICKYTFYLSTMLV